MQERLAGKQQGINSPIELPRIGQTVAALRGLSPEELREATTANAHVALPKLNGLSVDGSKA